MRVIATCLLSNTQEQFDCQLIETFIRETARANISKQVDKFDGSEGSRTGPPNGSRPILPIVHRPKVNLWEGSGLYCMVYFLHHVSRKKGWIIGTVVIRASGEYGTTK